MHRGEKIENTKRCDTETDYTELMLSPVAPLSAGDRLYSVVDDKIQKKLKRFGICGEMWHTKSYCKDCAREGEINQIEYKKVPFYCEDRYCKNPDCKAYSFARILERLKHVPQFVGLRTLWHGAIGFEKINYKMFVDYFPIIKKRLDNEVRIYFNRLNNSLKKDGVELNGLIFMDFSFVDDKNVYPHYHFLLKPINADKRRIALTKMQIIRKAVMEREVRKPLYSAVSKTPFHVQVFKHLSISEGLAYASKRTVGLYKYREGGSSEKGLTKGKLKRDIENKDYFMLCDMMDPVTYFKNFASKRYLRTIGKVKIPAYGSILTDKNTYYCSKHGHLDEKTQVITFRFKPEEEYLYDPPDIQQILGEKLNVYARKN